MEARLLQNRLQRQREQIAKGELYFYETPVLAVIVDRDTPRAIMILEH